MDLIGNEGRLLVRLMSAATLRERVIANNIAQQSTPGYKRQVVVFEDLLKEELRRGSADVEALEPRIETDLTSPAGPDGNNVNLELEMTANSQNRLMYEAYAALLEGQMELVRAAIEEGR